MALTYRNVKGSALTINELDANFSYFTGSHPITGSLTIDYNNIGGAALIITSSDGYQTSVIITELPTSQPLVTGSLWISGSGIGNASGSGYLMVFRP